MKSLILAFTLILSITSTTNAQNVGFVEQEIAVPHHDRKMHIAVMFPAMPATGQPTLFGDNPVFYGTEMIKNAKPAQGNYPVILLSHGWGGNYDRMAWLGAGLAAKGAVIVAVNHPGSTTRDIKLKTAIHHWTRAEDMSAALTHILNDPAFAPVIDRSRLYAAGFSYGGWTALSLAGVRGTREGFFTYCKHAGAQSQFCADLAAQGVDITAIDQGKYGASYKDARITAVAAIDPGLTWGLAPKDVQDATIPLLLIGLGTGDDRLDATDTGRTGSNFEALVPRASVKTIAPATHFTALGLCKPAGEAILIEEQDDPVCTDPTGTNRAQVLGSIITALADHFHLNEPIRTVP